MNYKKCIILFIIIILIFIIGISMVLYPYFSQYVYEKNAGKVIRTYTKISQSFTEQEIEEEFQKCYEYNRSLLENYVVMTDPFDQEKFPVVKNEYKNLLNLTEVMANIIIPSINADLPIFHGTSDAVLTKGVGHLENTSLPVGGPGTHAVVSAHRGLTSAKLFTDLDKVKQDDLVIIKVLNKTLYYKVTKIEIVKPSEVQVLKAEPGKDMVTMITCTPYGINTHRLLVHAERITDDVQLDVAKIEEEKTQNTNIFTKDLVLTTLTILSCLFVILILIFLLIIRKKNQKVKQTNDTDYTLEDLEAEYVSELNIKNNSNKEIPEETNKQSENELNMLDTEESLYEQINEDFVDVQIDEETEEQEDEANVQVLSDKDFIRMIEEENNKAKTKNTTKNKMNSDKNKIDNDKNKINNNKNKINNNKNKPIRRQGKRFR